MTSSDLKNPKEHWSDYWSRGCLTSLPQDFAANYDGEVRTFWHRHFARVPADGRLVDLCTGNGAIALLAAEYARKRGHALKITAVDAATIRPDLIATQFPDQAALLENIEFASGTQIEDLELSQQFDLAASQYGLEYCEHEPAGRSVSRLLKPGGRLVMVCHAPGSDMIAYMSREREEYRLLEELGLFLALRAYLDRESPHGELTAALQRIQERLQPEFRNSGSALFRSVLETLGGILAMPADRLEASRAHLEAYYGQLRHGLDRLRDMLRVNRALIEDPGWTRVFESAGLAPIEHGALQYRGRHHAGDYHVFEKPAAGEF